MLVFKKKSAYGAWYQENKQRLSEKRKKLYAENPEYRQRAVEASRRYRSGERSPLVSPVPPDGLISFSQTAERLDVGLSTLREWRSKGLFPEARRHNRGLWLIENQVLLLRRIKDFSKYRMRPAKFKQARLAETKASILANWN
jgi:hypothetical protein